MSRYTPKKPKLVAQYGTLDGETDIIISWGPGVSKCDAHLLYNVISSERKRYDGQYDKSLVDELKARGYDIATLRFSVTKTH